MGERRGAGGLRVDDALGQSFVGQKLLSWGVSSRAVEITSRVKPGNLWQEKSSSPDPLPGGQPHRAAQVVGTHSRAPAPVTSLRQPCHINALVRDPQIIHTWGTVH